MKFLSVLPLFFILFFPDLVAAQGIPMVCEGTECSACHLVDLANSVIVWLIGILFVLFGVLAAIAGVKLVISGGNPGARQEAKQSFTNAFIGLFIVLAAFLIVDTLMRFVLRGNDGVIQGFGPWSRIECGEQFTPIKGVILVAEPEILEEGGSFFRDSEIPIDTNTTSGPIQQRIAAATASYRGASTASGPGGGNVACAWAVNNVLRKAGISNIGGDSVRNMEQALVGGRGVKINQSQAVTGDLVLVIGARTKSGKTGNHVGICINTGCTRVLSNSSSKKQFIWESGPSFSPSYIGGTPRFYRVKN